MNRLIFGLLLGFGVVGLLNRTVYAVNPVVAPKDAYVLSYTTTVSTVTPNVSTNSVANAAYMPGVVYQVFMSSGATSEYVMLYDTNTTSGITCGATTNALTARIFFSSTSANTITRFDPPLHFFNGLVACDSAATGQSGITYEFGRGLSGD
jgi:hypothetical protein